MSPCVTTVTALRSQDLFPVLDWLLGYREQWLAMMASTWSDCSLSYMGARAAIHSLHRACLGLIIILSATCAPIHTLHTLHVQLTVFNMFSLLSSKRSPYFVLPLSQGVMQLFTHRVLLVSSQSNRHHCKSFGLYFEHWAGEQENICNRRAEIRAWKD